MTSYQTSGSLDDESEFEVEELVDVRYDNGEPQYLIKWKGHPPEMNSWEPHFNLNCPLLLMKFHAERNRPRITVVDIVICVCLMTLLQPESTEPYGFDRGLPPDFINMVTKKDGELYFLIKWKGTQICDVVPAAQANIRCPQVVIKFYESILHFN
ncbi:hypothetical protein P879_01292 [Paragonimus westermani]|uniref:Chromo domain-containing protein n=1 Tax=Paragonimus westermani TaxID=34504 RepID=A0A8T0DQ03_9TREM|nr:hypothetical protein P879_01292 [Paragonimus westermani]